MLRLIILTQCLFEYITYNRTDAMNYVMNFTDVFKFILGKSAANYKFEVITIIIM